MENQKRLIDANALRDKLQNITADVCQEICDGFYKLGMSKPLVYLAIAETTTIDAVEVVHGRWEFDCACEPYCSVCGEYALQLGFEKHASNYCPNCGAKMDG